MKIDQEKTRSSVRLGEGGEVDNPQTDIGVVLGTMLEDSDFILRPRYTLKAGL